MKVTELKAVDIKTTTDKEDLVFLDVDNAPFRLYGIFRDGEKYRRVPSEVAEKCNDFLKSYQLVTAGGRVRFCTTSEYISVRVTLTGVVRKDNMSDVLASGADVYIGNKYHATVNNHIVFDAATGEKLHGVLESAGGGIKEPEAGVDIAYEAIVGLGDTNGQVITINLPVFNGVKNVYIGVKKDAEISRAPDYSLEKPIVFYGSSITHGASASRPGNIYENTLSRAFDFNYINLGFGGGARGEDAIADYIAGLDMSAFVLDYDHNAPSVEHLEATHERVFKKIREKHPDIPVLMLSRPYGKLTSDVTRRQEVVRATYENAKANGDENVWLVLGSEYFPDEYRSDFSIEGTHPNDLGFMFMAEAMKPAIKEMVETVKSRGVK